MKTIPSLLLTLFLAATAAASNEETFVKAQGAYDKGHYAEAALLYERLLSNGVVNAEVHYNLANANFKDGHLPEAVRHYRIAEYSAPRDPDIKANLHFALSAAGAVDPAPAFIERVFFTLSLDEWILAAVISYAILMLLLILSLLLPGRRRMLLKSTLLPLALVAVSAGGWNEWYRLKTNPEWVVIRNDATALYGPVDGSTAHYKPPLGALVRQCGTDPKGWIEIAYDGKRGWLKSEYISRISP